jgi:hypothetical protein
MLTKVPRDETAEIIVAAARGEADIDEDGLALVERVRLGGVRRDVRPKQQSRAGDGREKSFEESIRPTVLHAREISLGERRQTSAGLRQKRKSTNIRQSVGFIRTHDGGNG